MIISNGTMQTVCINSGGIDEETGEPICQQEALGEEMPVNISGNRHRDNYTGDGGVAYTSAKYEVLCEVTTTDAREVVLTNSRGERLGRFRVQDIAYLDCVDAVKIIAERYAD